MSNLYQKHTNRQKSFVYIAHRFAVVGKIISIPYIDYFDLSDVARTTRLVLFQSPLRLTVW